MSREAFADLVRWYAEIGVDIALDEAPHDRFAEAKGEAQASEPSAPLAAPPGAAPLRPQAAIPIPAATIVVPSAARTAGDVPSSHADQDVQSARELAVKASTL